MRKKHCGYQRPPPPIHQNLSERWRRSVWRMAIIRQFAILLSPQRSIIQLSAEPQRTFAFRNFLVWRWTRALSVSRFSTGVKLSFSLCPCTSVHKTNTTSVTLSSAPLACGGEHECRPSGTPKLSSLCCRNFSASSLLNHHGFPQQR